MNRDEIRGKAQNWKGRAKQAAGVLTGDRKTETEGAEERDSGAARERVGRARREVGEAIEDLGRKIRK